MKKNKLGKLLLAVVAITALALTGVAVAQTKSFRDGWPRMYESRGNSVVVHQPQLDEWVDYELITAGAAVSVKLKGDDKEYFGAMYLKADTETDLETRKVLLKNFQITDMVFPNVDDRKAGECKSAVENALPKDKTLVISLDRIMAGLDRAKQQTKSIEVNFNPPTIYHSKTPAQLVIFNGEPKFEAVDGAPDLLFAVNTNWDILLERGSSRHFMLYGESWLVTENIMKGPWKRARKLPKAFKQLPDDENWKDVKEKIPGKRAELVPTVFVSTVPAELIVTEGSITRKLIVGTKLSYIANTESDLFYYSGDRHIYFLTAGRWFRAKSLSGPWSAASLDMPEDFSDIPVTHEKAHVLSSVPGTPEAEAAVLLASVPIKATVERKKTAITVPYEGEPIFVEIEDTAPVVYYAVNTPYSVFRVGRGFYSVHNGVWFTSLAATGPWLVATEVPTAIYSIPPTHPKHNVTYVYIYESTPETVVVGYTSGYSGTYIATTGVVVYGAGYWSYYDPYYIQYYHYHYHPYYYSYGAAFRYNYYYGGYYRSASYYGPYGGAGGWSGYNPAAGTYYRGGYAYGPYGGAFAREAYNPYTNRYAAQVGAKTPYGSWGRTVASKGSKWAKGGHRSYKDKVVGGVKTSEGAAAIGRYDKESGQGAVVGKDKYGNVYVGRGGDIYSRDEDGWNKRVGDGWKKVKRPWEDSVTKPEVERSKPRVERPSTRVERPSPRVERPSPRVERPSPRIERPKPRDTYRDRIQKRSVSKPAVTSFDRKTRSFDNLNRAHKARNLGNQRSRNFKQGGGRVGGGGRAGGGGRRR